MLIVTRSEHRLWMNPMDDSHHNKVILGIRFRRYPGRGWKEFFVERIFSTFLRVPCGFLDEEHADWECLSRWLYRKCSMNTLKKTNEIGWKNVFGKRFYHKANRGESLRWKPFNRSVSHCDWTCYRADIGRYLKPLESNEKANQCDWEKEITNEKPFLKKTFSLTTRSGY